MLNQAVAERQAEIARGQAAIRALDSAFNQQADAMSRALSERLGAFETLFYEKRELIRLWRGEEEVNRWSETLSRLKRLLKEQAYRDMEAALSKVESSLGKQIAEVEALEAKQQKRLYLLRSLRQVCHEMDFRELGMPAYEQEGQRGSRILYRVDTLDRGKSPFISP